MLNRRSLLQTIPSAVTIPYLYPIVKNIIASEAHDKKPMRFVFVVEGNGLWPEQVMPQGFKRKEMKNPRGGDHRFHVTNGEDALIDLPLGTSDTQLCESVKPLEKHTDKLTLLTGLSGRVAGGGHGNGFGALGAYPAVAGPKDITIDCALARTSPSVREMISMGFWSDPATSPAMSTSSISSFGPNQKASVILDPVLAHKMLFGKIIGGNPKAEVGVQSLILETAAKDINQTKKIFGGEEARKLERVAEAFHNISKRQSRLADIDPSKIPSVKQDFHGSKSETVRMKAHAEIAATALITGLTNTVTLLSGIGYPTWKGLGINIDTHDIGHRANDFQAIKDREKIRKFNAELICQLVDTLEAVPEGNGTMMDNTLIVYLSDSAETHHSVCMEWPMILVGNLGGRLNLGGRFVNVPRYGEKGHITVAQFYTSLLHSAGSPVDHFGMKDRFLLEAGLDQREPWAHILS